MVIRAVRTEHTWNMEGCVKVAHDIELSINPPEGNNLQACISPRLLPGGWDAVILNCGRLELWSLDTRTRLWACPQYEGGHYCLSFDMDLSEDGKTLNIAGVFDSMVHANP